MEFLYAILAVLGILVMITWLFIVGGYAMICLGGHIVSRTETDDDYNTIVTTYAEFGKRRFKLLSLRVEEE